MRFDWGVQILVALVCRNSVIFSKCRMLPRISWLVPNYVCDIVAHNCVEFSHFFYIFFRSQKIIDYFSSKPLGDSYANYYPPMKKYNSLLRKLRMLGIYHDEHMVSESSFDVSLKHMHCIHLNVSLIFHGE